MTASMLVGSFMFDTCDNIRCILVSQELSENARQNHNKHYIMSVCVACG